MTLKKQATEIMNQELRQGLILKGIDGFYYVETPQGIVECRARGIFRRLGLTPLAGDRVQIRIFQDGDGAVEQILPRRNSLFRPPVANIDQLAVVVSTCEPSPNLLLTDRMLVGAEAAGIEPFLVFSKMDLKSAGELCGIYRNSGVRFFCISALHGEGTESVKSMLAGKITAFTGNSGAGKSTLLNAMFGGLYLQTGEISRKLGRGRHTTRQVELYSIGSGGYVVDTPGFSSLDSALSGAVTLENLPLCFREFRPYLGSCRFASCSHTCEKGCAVLEAVQEGKISHSRHESYTEMYREMKEKKPWMKKEKSV